MTVLVPYLLGAASTLAVQLVIQFWVVPRVETRKRREDRWERNVSELGELLTTVVDQLAQEAHVAQGVFREIRQRSDDPEPDQAKVIKGIPQLARQAREATWAFGRAVSIRVDWLAERVAVISREAPEITELQRLRMLYGFSALDIRGWHAEDDRSDDEFEAAWDKEYKTRTQLIKQVKLLAVLPHPPRTSFARRWWWRVRRWGRQMRSPRNVIARSR